MAKKPHLYGLHLEFGTELSNEDQARLNKIFEKAAEEAVAKLNLKERPKINFPVKPPRPVK
jgi:hypothetical protein